MGLVLQRVAMKADEGLVFNLYWLPSKMDASTTDGLGFRNLAYIQHMFEKYNQWVRLYGDLAEMKREINTELTDVSNDEGLNLKSAIRKTKKYNTYVDYISKFELNVLLLNQLIEMFERFSVEFPVIASDVIDLKLIGEKSVPKFALAKDSLQDNLFRMEVRSDKQRPALMRELVVDFAKIRAKTASLWESNKVSYHDRL